MFENENKKEEVQKIIINYEAFFRIKIPNSLENSSSFFMAAVKVVEI
jgi:hypothetical protein